MKQLIDKSALVAEIERRIKQFVKENNTLLKNSDNAKELRSRIIMCKEVLSLLDTLEVKEMEEEPVSNDLEEAAYQFGNCFENHFGLASMSFIKGAKWQKEQTIYKACNYLFSHMGLFVTFFDDDIVEDIERSEFIKKFRIAMEDK